MLIRRSTVALLLLAQGLGLLHLALESHTEGAAGEWLDSALLREDAHHGDAPHLCAPEHGAAQGLSKMDCAVIAAFHAPALITPAESVRCATPELPPVLARVSAEAPPQDVLSRAPKSSPPAA